MKVAFLASSLNPGGVSTLLSNLLPELRKRGIVSEIIVTLRRGLIADVLEREGFKIHTCLQHWDTEFPSSYTIGKYIRRSAAFSFWLRLSRLLKKIKPDVLQSNIHGMQCTSQLIAARIAGVPFVLRLGSPSSTYQATWRNRHLFCTLLRSRDRIFGVSKSVYEAYPQFFHKVKNNVLAPHRGIPNGIRDPGLRDHSVNSEIRQKLGISADSLVLGSVGRLIPTKQYQDLISSAVEVIKSNKQINVVLIGDGSARLSLEQQVKDSGYAAHFHFLGSQTNPTYWLNTIDIFIYPSQFEAFPNSVLEAMAKGVPIICSDVCGNSDLIKHKHNGLLYPLHEVKALTQLILNFISSPDLRRTVSENARRDYLEAYQVSACLEHYLKIYNEICDPYPVL
jgi:glycosyltransferase involved in cell wall biosynthesis